MSRFSHKSRQRSDSQEVNRAPNSFTNVENSTPQILLPRSCGHRSALSDCLSLLREEALPALRQGNTPAVTNFFALLSAEGSCALEVAAKTSGMTMGLRNSPDEADGSRCTAGSGPGSSTASAGRSAAATNLRGRTMPVSLSRGVLGSLAVLTSGSSKT